MKEHDQIRDLLAAYADQALDKSARQRVGAHALTCAECAAEEAGLRRLNATLADFPPAPAISFHRFWAKLRLALPVQRRARWFTPRRRLALAFAMAALATVTVGTAVFASASAMPDNPLYPVKRTGEQIQLTFALDQQSRVHLEVRLAAERLREAQVMARRKNAILAVAALKDFDDLLNAAEPALKHPANQPEREAVDRVITALRLQLAGVEDINEREGDDREVKDSVRIAERVLDKGEPVEPERGITERETERPKVER